LFNDTATRDLYTLSLHDALPIWMADRLPPLKSVQLRPNWFLIASASCLICRTRFWIELLSSKSLDRKARIFSGSFRKARISCWRSEEHTSELQSRENIVCRLLLE